MNKLLRKRIRQATLWVLVLILAAPPLVVSAVSCDPDFYSANDVRFYDACEVEPLACTVSSAVGSFTNSKENAEAIFKYLISNSFSTLGGKPMTAIQAAAVLGNVYGESGFDPSAIQSGKAFDMAQAMNPGVSAYGFGIVQWDLSRRVDLLNYAKDHDTINDASQVPDWTNLGIQLDFLKKELESTEAAVMKDSQFQNATDVSVATVRWRELFERTGPSSDSKRITSAQEYLALYQNLAPGVISASAGSCVALSTTGAGGNGDITTTAIALSWSQRASEGATDHTVLQNKPEYTAALASTGVNKLGDSCSMAGNGCDAFLATVMRLSGADPNFPCCGSGAQNDYMKSHTELYEVVTTDVKDTSQLVAGDLMWRSGHVKIYIGDGREAAASHCARTAEQSVLYLDGTYTAYRFKKAASV